YNEIGIDLNFNMKRERLTSGEVSQNSEVLFPLTNNMFRNRVQGVEQLNEKYNLDVKVDYGSIWKERAIKEDDEEDETIEPDEEDETIGSDEEDETIESD